MDNCWWTLPGPGSFILDIVQALREGKNVVLCLPKYSEIGIAAGIRSALKDEEGWSWKTVNLDEIRYEEPIEALFSLFEPARDKHGEKTLRTLLELDTLSGSVLWLDGISDDKWPAWKKFIQEYSHACTSQSIINRCLLCIPLLGSSALNVPNENVGLILRIWKGVVSSLDMQTYVWNLLREKHMGPFQKRIAVSIITNISLWDPYVATCLSERPIESILEPYEVLQSISRERQWNSSDEYTPEEEWSEGITNIFEGKKEFHSAYFSFGDNRREIAKRIWSAEVGIAFPFIEEMRRMLLEKFEKILKVPYKTTYGEIDSLLDLEIGHIESQVYASRIEVAPEIKRVLRTLREMRNSLSHLEPLRPAIILEEDIQEILNTTQFYF